MTLPTSAPVPGLGRHREPLDRDERKARFERLAAEFVEAPDEAGMERVLEAFVSWHRSRQNSRCLGIDGELAALEREAKRRIELRRRSCDGA